MKLVILTPDKTVFDGVVKSVKLPSHNGEVEILPQHINYITTLKAGEIIVHEKLSMPVKKIKIKNGLTYVKDNVVKLLVALDNDIVSG